MQARKNAEIKHLKEKIGHLSSERDMLDSRLQHVLSGAKDATRRASLTEAALVKARVGNEQLRQQIEKEIVARFEEKVLEREKKWRARLQNERMGVETLKTALSVAKEELVRLRTEARAKDMIVESLHSEMEVLKTREKGLEVVEDGMQNIDDEGVQNIDDEEKEKQEDEDDDDDDDDDDDNEEEEEEEEEQVKEDKDEEEQEEVEKLGDEIEISGFRVIGRQLSSPTEDLGDEWDNIWATIEEEDEAQRMVMTAHPNKAKPRTKEDEVLESLLEGGKLLPSIFASVGVREVICQGIRGKLTRAGILCECETCKSRKGASERLFKTADGFHKHAIASFPVNPAKSYDPPSTSESDVDVDLDGAGGLAGSAAGAVVDSIHLITKTGKPTSLRSCVNSLGIAYI